jgi:hypothetical protein
MDIAAKAASKQCNENGFGMYGILGSTNLD